MRQTQLNLNMSKQGSASRIRTGSRLVMHGAAAKLLKNESHVAVHSMISHLSVIDQSFDCWIVTYHTGSN